MKKLLFFALLLIATIGAKADEITGALKVAADKQTATLHVSLTNDQSYVAFQMDVTLPEGWTVTSAAPVGTSRLDGEGDGSAVGDTKFNLAYNVIGGNKLRVLAYNLANDVIKGTKGDELFTVELTKSGDAPADVTSWTATFSDVLFVSKDNVTQTLAEAEMAVTNTTVTGEAAALIGDINNSGTVNNNDLTAMVDIIVRGESSPSYSTYNLQAADVNQNGEINANDLTALVQILINQ